MLWVRRYPYLSRTKRGVRKRRRRDGRPSRRRARVTL